MSGMDDSEFKKKTKRNKKKSGTERKREGVQILFYLIVFYF